MVTAKNPIMDSYSYPAISCLLGLSLLAGCGTESWSSLAPQAGQSPDCRALATDLESTVRENSLDPFPARTQETSWPDSHSKGARAKNQPPPSTPEVREYGTQVTLWGREQAVNHMETPRGRLPRSEDLRYTDNKLDDHTAKEPNLPKPANSDVLELDYLVELARRRHPTLVAAWLNVEAARGRLIQAGLYPNPVLGYEGQEIAEGRYAGTHGPFLAQEIVLGDKLRLAQQVALAELRAADWEAVSQWFELLTRIRTGWVELLAAEYEVRIYEGYLKLIGEQEGGLVYLARRLAKVEGFRWELLQAEIEMQAAQARLAAAQRRRDAARQELAAIVGVATLPTNLPSEPLPLKVPQYSWEGVLSTALFRSAQLQEARALIQRAEHEWRLIAAQNIPNLTVRISPSYNFESATPSIFVETSLPLPVFNRQQGNLLAAQAAVSRQRQLLESIKLDLTRRLANAYGRYTAALQQARRYTQEVLPRATESITVMRTLFEKARAEELRVTYLGLLQAYRAWLDAQLGELQARRELWLAVYEIAGILQQEKLESLP